MQAQHLLRAGRDRRPERPDAALRRGRLGRPTAERCGRGLGQGAGAAGPVADADSAPCAAGDTTAPGVRVRQGWGVGARTRGGVGEGSALGAEVRGEGVGTEGKQRGLSESRPQRPSVWMPTSGGPATAGQRPRAH